jgi:hypothetical protein
LLVATGGLASVDFQKKEKIKAYGIYLFSRTLRVTAIFSARSALDIPEFPKENQRVISYIAVW